MIAARGTSRSLRLGDAPSRTAPIGLGKRLGDATISALRSRRDVAQLARARGSGPRGRRFKSFRPDQSSFHHLQDVAQLAKLRAAKRY